LGFDFHSCQTLPANRQKAEGRGASTTSTSTTTTTTNLILTQWLPSQTKSRLPLGPFLQAGVGCVVLHPADHTKMLVVQELTGPAAARNLWKMPTGLLDPGEDIEDAAQRELQEETGLTALHCEGILAFRQAHGSAAGRASSDLFFVCLMSIPLEMVDTLQACQQEIKAIQWMSVDDYANQETWQLSPTYKALNQAILDHVQNLQHQQHHGGNKKPTTSLVTSQQLPVGFVPGTNTVYRSNL
jgi:ADP-ribose pyrophosphatase YjhB (NUDIX family)